MPERPPGPPRKPPPPVPPEALRGRKSSAFPQAPGVIWVPLGADDRPPAEGKVKAWKPIASPQGDRRQAGDVSPKSPTPSPPDGGVVWHKLDEEEERASAPQAPSIYRSSAKVRPSDAPSAFQAPPSAPPRKERVLSPDHVRVNMRPDEVPGMVHYYDQTGVRRMARTTRETWGTDSPVLSFPTQNGDSLIIGPSLDPGYRDRPQGCQDRAALEYGNDGRLRAFAIGDGVSQGMASASVAEKLTQKVAVILAEARERIVGRLPKKGEIVAMLDLVQNWLRAHTDPGAMADDFLRYTTMHPDFANHIVEDLRSGRSVGSSTLLAGMIQSGEYPGTREMGEHVTLVTIGDGGYVVIGPYRRRDASVFGKFEPAGRAPDQVAPGKAQNLGPDAIHVQHVALRRGEVLLAVTDGIEKGVWKTLEQFQGRAQELFEQGYTDPNRLVRQLLWEATQGSCVWADDTTIFAHQAR